MALSAVAFDFYEPVQPPRPFQVMVHRGALQQAPENTVPAIEHCIDSGYEWVEVDVRITKDGHHIVFHDNDIDDKTSGSGRISEHTLAELKALDAGASFAPRFAGTRLLTLAECLALCKGRINLYLDCKRVDIPLLAREVAAAGMESQVLVFAVLDDLAELKKLSKGKIPTMTKWHPEFGTEDWVAKWKPDAVEINADEITAEICAFFHGKGIRVQAKVLNEKDRPEVWDRVLAAGADWLQTDRPEDIIAHRLWAGLKEKSIEISLHRGAGRFAPENTVPAYEKAIAMGIDYVEFDVRTSKDGKYFILHDHDLDRTTNAEGPISDAESAAIRALDAGSWFGKPSAGLPVPTLDETLQLLKGRTKLYVDAKDIPVEDLARKLEEYGVVDQAVVYQSPGNLRKLRKINPAIRALCPLSNPDRIDRLCDSVHPYAFDVSWDILSADLIRRCHERGVKVFSDALGENERIDKYQLAMEWGIDLIQTDHPLRVIHAVYVHTKGQNR